MLRFVLSLALAAPLVAQSTAIAALERRTIGELHALDERTVGLLGVAAMDLTTRRVWAYHGDVLFPQASSIKIPILIRVYQAVADGNFRLSERVTLTDKDSVGGSGFLQKELARQPVTISMRELVTAMIEASDNTATNYFIRRVGMAEVNAWLRANGFVKTRLQRVMLDVEAAKRGEENISTPEEMVRIAALLHDGKAVSRAASQEMIDIMRRVKANFRKALPPGTDIASKPGAIPGVKCETGIVYLTGRPFALSVMTSLVPENSGVVGEAAAVVYRHFQTLAASGRELQ